MIDDREPKDTEFSSNDTAQSVIRVLNKIDLSGRTPGVLNTVDQEDESPSPTVAVSAVTGAGIHDLEQMIIHCLGIGEAETTSPFSARERHVTCLKRAEAALDEASDRFQESQACELLAEDLKRVHTELGAITGAFGADDMLGEIFGHRPVMAFTGSTMRVALVTTHLPLADVPSAVTSAMVEHTVRTAHRALIDDLGLEAPRLYVCGLNPHAGEDGELGKTEKTVIAPVIERLRGEGMSVEGPICAEAAFMTAARGEVDMVVAMYHDQGLVPLKVVDFGRSVNWTLGLPIIRTSVDHGTADALVGTGNADPSSMQAAIRLAMDIVRRRRTS